LATNPDTILGQHLNIHNNMPKIDVLIAGSGSAGIFAATWLAVFNIPFTILEKRAHGLEVGQADGLQCRTVEIFESFGVAEELLREAFHVYEVCFWGEDGHGGIKRTSRTVDTENGLSHQPHLILNQARVNNIMLQKMEDILKEKNGNGSIKYGWEVKSVEVDSSRKDDPDAYCCKVRAESDGKEEVWEAKYVLVILHQKLILNVADMLRAVTVHILLPAKRSTTTWSVTRVISSGA
jgi:phenol 2-monooxygenase (NADPH)